VWSQEVVGGEKGRADDVSEKGPQRRLRSATPAAPSRSHLSSPCGQPFEKSVYGNHCLGLFVVSSGPPDPAQIDGS